MPDPDVVDGAILWNAADHLHAVFRAPDRPARTIPASTSPASTLSNADPAGDLSGDGGVIQIQKTPAGDGGGQKFYGVKPVPEISPGNPHWKRAALEMR